MKKLGVNPTVDPTADVRDSRLGRFTEIGARTSFIESSLDDYSYIVNDGEVIYATIGKFCSIAAMVRINPGNHPMWRASQSHFTYRASAYFENEADEAAFFDWRRASPVHIGHDVWIGHGAIILPGRSIGNGAVIAAGAVVSRDIPAYAIAAGVPAKVIKRRFSQAIEDRLQALAWWDWGHDVLQSSLEDFRNLSIEEFLERYETMYMKRKPV